MPAIDIAQLAIYAMLSIPVVYCLVKHGRTGFLGWFYLLGFCGLRLAAAGMENSNKNNSSNSQGTLIVENIGLTPLLLGSIGVLHEARVTSKLTRQPKVEWIGILFYHILVSSAVALMVVGITNLTSTTNGQPSSRSSSSGLLKGGFVVIFLCWVLLTVFALWSWSTARRSRASSVPYALDREQEAQPTFDERGKSRATQDRDGSSLLFYGVLFSVPMILLRAIYGAISLFEATSFSSSNISTNLAANVCMAVVPQILTLLGFVIVGLATRNISKASY